MKKHDGGLYLLLISIHGLIRRSDLELGRDADTGGQIKYVVELAHALACHPRVGRVDLLTRRVNDATVSVDYSRAEEKLCKNARIIRLPAGPEQYIRKEALWDHLDGFADDALVYLKNLGLTPNIIHSHYADAGYVGVRLANMLGVPLIHTGHSLGRVKRRRLLATGLKREQIEATYTISRRVEAEEETLAAAELVIASTSNEIEEQYGLYDYYRPELMAVIPPGTDLECFHPPSKKDEKAPIFTQIGRFLNDQSKPMILALSRPDERKNIATLIQAFGESAELQRIANLVIIAGNRDDLRDMDAGSQSVLNEMLVLIDCYDLYGKVAYPKQHRADEVSVIYRIAAASKGVFVNPALTEPFGLTLIEAAASGLPIVATEDGGPRDIIGNCKNGVLIDPLDKTSIITALLKMLSEPRNWKKFRNNGIAGVQAHYSWVAHAESYIQNITPILQGVQRPKKGPLPRRPLLYHDRAIVVELDQAMLGDIESLKALLNVIRDRRGDAGFGIATGRGLESTLKVLKRFGIPMPDVLIVGMGTELYYAPQLTADIAWADHIDHQWNPKAVHRILADVPGLERQPKSEQLRYKVSYYIDANKAPGLEEINRLIRQNEENVNVFISYGQFLDILPARASKGFALRYFAQQWGIPLERILVAGGTAGDEDMMRGNTLSVVVANPHRKELSDLSDVERVFFSEGEYARGILEAIEYYDFYAQCLAPPDKDINVAVSR
ncbi:MAG: glycosyltransferase [Gammaproteobacteria bacterium]|nr:glycosyltransferase [Gammaproteobacteria bacterium]